MLPLQVGAVLHGYCNGFFGDSYHCKRVEGVGADWIVAREMNSLRMEVLFGWFENRNLPPGVVEDWLRRIGECDCDH